MAFGMSFTLAFLPVGLIVALTVIGDSSASLANASAADPRDRRRASSPSSPSAGPLTAANPFVIAIVEPQAPRGFYVEYPRTYALWLWVNPVEMVIALGVPAAVWCLLG